MHGHPGVLASGGNRFRRKIPKRPHVFANNIGVQTISVVAKELDMGEYRVKFFKNLLSSDGHQFKVLQRTIDVRRSKSRERAEKAARHRFERCEEVRNWNLHADTIEVELLP